MNSLLLIIGMGIFIILLLAFIGFILISYKDIKSIRLIPPISHNSNGNTEPCSAVDKITGVDIRDLIFSWVNLHAMEGFYLALYDINVENKSANFWLNLPGPKKMILLNEVVVLRCKDKREVRTLQESIDPDFAKTMCFYNGCVIHGSIPIDEIGLPLE